MKFKSFLSILFSELIAFAPISVPVVHAQTAAQLPPGKQCFQGTAGINGMVGTIGTITPGSGYTNGSYGGVALTGGSGTNATANITVAGGVVSAVTILNPGAQYVVGDTLSAAAASIGGSGSGFSFPVASTSINSSLAGGSVGYYIPATLTIKQTWQNSTETTLNQNPVPLDANGCALVYGSGTYRQIVQDSLGNTIWDTLTTPGGGGSSGTLPASSQGVMVGTIIPWVNNTLPPNYLYTAGQAVSRTTYSQLFTAMEYSVNILCTLGIATITVPTNVSDAVPIGAPIETSCFAPGTTVSTKSSGQLTMSSNATTTVSTTGVLFPWGNGDGATTFNIPDLRGRVIAGRDNMNSSIAATLTSTYYGVNPDAVNAVGGNQAPTMTLAQLPSITSTNPAQNIAVNSPSTALSGTGSSNVGSGSNFAVTEGSFVSTGTVSISVVSTNTSGNPHPTVQPSMTSDYIIKVLPDSASTGPGVTSLGGMTGIIACAGTGITCNANTVTVNALTPAGVSSFGGMAGSIACGTGLVCGGGTASVSGVFGNNSQQSSNYTALNADDHTTIFLTGSTANQTITVNALSSYSDAKYSLQVCNRGTHRWTISSADAGNLFLWPGQCNTLQANSISNVLTYQLQQQRYRCFQCTYYLAASSCNDANDGLTPDSFGQLCTGNTLVALLQSQTDGANSDPLIQLADGTYNQSFSNTGTSPCCSDGITIQGDVSVPSNTIIAAPANNSAFFARDLTAWLVQNLEIACTNSASSGVSSTQSAVIDVKNVIFGSCTSNVMAQATEGGHVDFNTGNTIAGNASLFCYAFGVGSTCAMSSQTFTCSGSPAFSIFVEAANLGYVNAPGAVFSSCSGVAAQRYVAGGNGVINSGGGGATFFPGNVGGSTTTGGQYE